jgi:hypothetical protein
VVTCSTAPPLKQWDAGYVIQCEQTVVGGTPRITATVVKKTGDAAVALEPVFGFLAGRAALASAADPYNIELHWAVASDVKAKVGVVLPGTLGCFNVPEPSMTQDVVTLTPSLDRPGCWQDKTFVGNEIHGITVYDPWTCGKWPITKPKLCPSAGTVKIHVEKKDGQEPVVTCSTAPPLKPWDAGYVIQCEQTVVGGTPRITATVVKKTGDAAVALELPSLLV